MFEMSFRIALRKVFKNKAHSLINICGLSVGMAIAILIGLWIWNELSFDKSFQHYDRIAQVMQNQTFNGEVSTNKGNDIPLAEELRRNYGENFKYIVLSSWCMNSLISSGDKKLNTQGNYMASDAPQMLSLKMVKGTGSGFNTPHAVLLSQSTAKALFGQEEPLGKTVKIDVDLNETVAGVYEDFPQNSSFKAVSFIAPFFDLTSWTKGNEGNWNSSSFQVFVQLADNIDPANVSAKIKDIKLHKLDAQQAKNEKPALFLQPMSRWHLYSEFKNGVNVGGAIQYVWMFSIIGSFVLLLACINFMNLSTARSEKRAKEVGIRKAIGSRRWQLISQFFSESLLLAAFAFLVSLLIVQLILPFFNSISAKQMILPWNSLYFWLAAMSFTAVTGVLAGIYPALCLSSFDAVKVLKGTFKAGPHAALPRKILVVTQFTVSIILIIGTVTVFRQLQFAKSRPIGYSRQGLVTLIMRTYNYHNNFANIRHDLLQQGTITDMAESNTPVTENDHFNNGFSWPGKDPQTVAQFNTVGITGGYGKAVGWQFRDGRDFSSQFSTDSSAIVINESAAKFMGLKNPVGKSVTWYGKPFRIIGVIRDMVMESPYEPAKPTVFNLDTTVGGILNIRLDPNKTTASTLASLETVCKRYSPEEAFDYSFADEQYAQKFADEERVGKLASFFAILALFISSLGIFGMASFSAEQRVKEIGVRKVLGASVFSLWQLLSREFVILVFTSFIIATPMAYYFMHNWLQNYQYRTSLAWWIFASTGIGTLLITLITVSLQSIKAAIASPADSLRAE